MLIFEHSWGDDEDPDVTGVDASFHENGHLVIRKFDYGPGVERSGASDMESLMVIDVSDVQVFMLEVLKATFSQHRPLTVKRLEHICANAGIKVQSVNSWG
tara:strand:- start:57 stop:359 length:303 start_codon:yes stop_codon:yes gene_type:complete